MKHLLFTDFESFYSSTEKYDLRKLSITEYVRSSRFKAFGLGVCGLKDEPTWISAKNIPAYLLAIEEQIGWANVAVVAHNIKFDGFILREIYRITPGSYVDTKGMSKGVLGKTARGHSLQLLSEHFGLTTNGMIGKGEMNTDGKETLTPEEEAQLATYCLGDVDLCRQLFLRLQPEFPENQYAALHQTVSMFVNPKLQLNVPLLEKTSTEEAQRRATIFTRIGIDKSVFASNAKFPALLKERGYEVPTKPSPRKVDSEGEAVQIPALALGDTEFLEMLESENEELKTLCEARVAAKSTLLETRSAKLAKIGRTGLWPFDIEFSGADQTHRFSGGKGAGGNPQNFTRGSALRTAVEAPAGFDLIVGDFSNIELRIVAYLSKDPGLVQAIEQGIDIYCDFASVFYGRKITKADKKERQFGKTAILGLGYGMGWEKFIKTVRTQTGETIGQPDAKKAIELYRTRYSKVPALWEKLHKMISYMADGTYDKVYWDLPGHLGHCFIQLPSGLKMQYPNLRQEEGKFGQMEWIYDVWHKNHLEQRKLYGGKVLENISQGLAGELCKEAMDRMDDATVGQVHDELHVLCRKGLGLVMAQKLRRAMSVSPTWLREMKLDAEVGIGANWGTAK